jgi:hypothetical protein
MYRRFFLHGLAVLLLCLFSVEHARAIPAVGTLNITGTVSVTPTLLDFQPPPGTSVGTVVSGYGNTGSFAAAVPSGTSGLIMDIPYTAGVARESFLTIGGFAFDLTSLEAGAFRPARCSASRPAAGQTCTPEGTALTLVNTTDHSCSVSLNLRGTFRGSLGEETPYVGVITFQYADRNLQQLVADLAAGGSLPPTAFSAHFAPAEQSAP